MVANNCWCMDG